MARRAWSDAITIGVLALGACNDEPLAPDVVVVPIDSVVVSPVSVALDPAGISPLAAELLIEAKSLSTVTVALLNDDTNTAHQITEPAREHRVPVLGLRPGVVNHVELVVSDELSRIGIDTVSIETPPLPEFFPNILVTQASPTLMEPGWNLSSFSVGDAGTFRSFPFIFDSDGRIRWYLDLSEFHDIVFMVERLDEGGLLFGSGSAVYEYDMLGNEVRRWEFPGYWFHHDVIEKPDGNLIVAVDNVALETVEDHIIELDRATGTIVRTWDLRQVLDVIRRSLFGSDVDWFHMNSVWFDDRDDALIISGRHQGVVKVSADNDLIWILAPHKGWGRAGPDQEGLETSAYLLSAVDETRKPYSSEIQFGDAAAADFDWPWGQHAAMILPNGHLFLFDNGDHRLFTPDPPHFSRGVEYDLDEGTMTVRQVWQYGGDRGAEYFSPIISDVDWLSTTENRLVMPGIVFGVEPRAFVTEVSALGEVVFEAEIRFKNLLSTADEGWGQFDLVYRSERTPLYAGEPGS